MKFERGISINITNDSYNLSCKDIDNSDLI